jgi:hypothetical protein
MTLISIVHFDRHHDGTKWLQPLRSAREVGF